MMKMLPSDDMDRVIGGSDGGVSTRRDFVVWSAVAFASVGCLAALWPLVDQMNPNSSSLRDTVDVDLSEIGLSQVKQVRWKGEPVLIRRRTRDEADLARRVLLKDLIDPSARVSGLSEKTSATDENRTKPGHPDWLVVLGVCTHCLCLVKASDRAFAFRPEEAFFCPCCASRFDLSGRVRAGPGRTNLTVPPYRFLTSSKIQIG